MTATLLGLIMALALPQGLVHAAEPAVGVRAVPRTPSVAQGGQLVIAVEMDLGTKYHAWPAAEVSLPAHIDEFAIRTEVRLTDTVPAWIGSVDGVQYPQAHSGKVADPTGEKPTIEVPLYSGKATTFVRLIVADAAPLGEQTVEIVVSYQACDESTCLQPEELTLPVKVRVVAKGTTDLGGENDPALFKGLDASKWGSGGGVPVQPPAPVVPKPAPVVPTVSPAATTPIVPSLFGVNVGTNVFVLFFAAAIGGCLLNLTPCVLPVIPIKIISLTKHASSRKHAIVLGLWMFAGVVSFWAAIGAPMAFISKSFDPSQYIFGIWWITLSIGLIIALMGLGIMGLFNLNLPQSVYSIEAKADSPWGSFLYGVLAAVLGLPCFGFMAGGLLAAVSSLPAVAIMAIFVGLGVGMGGPYLVLSAWPQLLKFIPRTGPASELVKQIMGILLLAAAAFFITAGIQVLLLVYPYLAGSMVWWAVGFFIAIASLWMIIRTFQITRKPIPRLFFTLLAVAMTLGIGLFAQDELRKDKASHAARVAAMSGAGSTANGNVPAGVWLEYSPELFAAVRAAGRPVFLEFTASWCITCKAIKAGVLDRDPVAQAFKDRGVVLMEVNCSAKDSIGSKKLNELGRTGVPAWVLYGPGSDQPVFLPVEKPTSYTVISALDAAGITTATANSGNQPALATGTWLSYTPELFAQARASGKVVVVDFNASWDLYVKKGNRLAIDREPVRAEVMRPNRVVLVEVDCSHRDAPGNALLKSLGGVNVPVLAIFGPGLSEPVLLTANKPGAIIDVINKAETGQPLAATVKK